MALLQHVHVFEFGCVCVHPLGPNQVSGTFCFGSSLMDEIFICAIDQEGPGPKLSVELPAFSSSNKIARAEYIS